MIGHELVPLFCLVLMLIPIPAKNFFNTNSMVLENPPEIETPVAAFSFIIRIRHEHQTVQNFS